MNGKVWMSRVSSNNEVGLKQGTRTKYAGRDWNPASFNIPAMPDDAYAAFKRYTSGFALSTADLPEAEAVFDEKRFKRRRDFFYIGPYMAAQGRLAETLSRFDLGQGGLIPFTIHQADLSTPHPGEFYIINLGARKNTLLPEVSKNISKLALDKKTGVQYWTISLSSEDHDVVVSDAALQGADLWVEETVFRKLFLTDALAQALISIGLADVFDMVECTVTADAG